MNLETNTMIPKQDIYRLRLKPFVDREITEDSIYLDKCNQDEWLEYLMTEMTEHISLERILAMPDDELGGYVGRLMSLDLVAGMLNDFTPEQMKIFDECLIRR